MTTDPPEPGGTQDGNDDGEGQRIHSLGTLNDKVDRIEQALARLVPGSRREAQDRVEERLDRPTSVQEQVQAELKKARDKDAADAAAQKEKDDQAADAQGVKDRLAKLEETKPVPPVRRATRLLGWGDRP